MATKFDISIKEVEKIPFSGIQSSKLILELGGNDINTVITNTLIRVSLDDIPTYAFPEDAMTIEYDDSIFNQDYMKLRLSQLPIFNIENEMFYLSPKYYQNINYGNKKREKSPDEKHQIEIIISSHNNTLDEMNVTTNDIKFIQDGIELKDKYDKDNPILLIQLKPNQTFKGTLRSAIGIGEKSDIWAAASNACHDDETVPNKILLKLASQGQMDEYEILVKACRYIKFKLSLIEDDIKKKIQEKKLDEKYDIHLDLENEDHTMGQLITNILQDNKDVIYAGMEKPDHLVRRVIIKIGINETVKLPLDVLFNNFMTLYKLFDHLEDIFWKLGAKYIKLQKSTNKSNENTVESSDSDTNDNIVIQSRKGKNKTNKAT